MRIVRPRFAIGQKQFPLVWTHISAKELLKVQTLEHVLIAKGKATLAKHALGGARASVTLAALIANIAVTAESAVPLRVEIVRFTYMPEMLSIKQGDVVEFVNLDVVPHTATNKEGGWDTQKLARGDTVKIRFDEPGIFNVICKYHPNMRGQINVTAK